jgi:Beta-lactamase enzyme family
MNDLLRSLAPLGPWQLGRLVAPAQGRSDRPNRTPQRLIGLALATLALAAPAASSAASCAPGAWRPEMRAAVSYARRRQGDIAFAVRFAGGFYGFRPDHSEWSASVVKAMLLVAYLDRPAVASRPLSGRERAVLAAMITRSDNDAADAIDSVVGARGLRGIARRAGMSAFAPAEPIWGESQITARDQTRFFLRVDSLVAARHRAFAMDLLASVVPSQRWGVGEVAPRGWKLYFKGGWGAGTGLVDNQVALLTRGCARVSVAVLTMHDGSHAYGKQTLRGLFARLLGGLPAGVR